MSIQLAEDAQQFEKSAGGDREHCHTPLTEESGEGCRVIASIERHRATVGRALGLLRQRCCEAGTVLVRGRATIVEVSRPNLFFGAQAANDASIWVEQVNRETECSATIFVLDGDEFVRVATTVRAVDGRPAVGTLLNSRGLAYGRLRRGQGHCGISYVLGNPLAAAYEPICSASGEVVGAIYAGHSL